MGAKYATPLLGMALFVAATALAGAGIEPIIFGPLSSLILLTTILIGTRQRRNADRRSMARKVDHVFGLRIVREGKGAETSLASFAIAAAIGLAAGVGLFVLTSAAR